MPCTLYASTRVYLLSWSITTQLWYIGIGTGGGGGGGGGPPLAPPPPTFNIFLRLCFGIVVQDVVTILN